MEGRDKDEMFEGEGWRGKIKDGMWEGEEGREGRDK